MNENVKVLDCTPAFLEKADKIRIGDEGYFIPDTFEAVQHPEQAAHGRVIQANRARGTVSLRTEDGTITYPYSCVMALTGMKMIADTDRGEMLFVLCLDDAMDLKGKNPEAWKAIADEFARHLIMRAVCFRLGISLRPSDELDQCTKKLIKDIQEDFNGMENETLESLRH